MTTERHTVELAGCAPVPLASYLKALGILRLVAEQVDSGAQGWWDGDTFRLRSSLDREALIHFFLETYRPTPLVGPWGARSGFFPGGSEKSAREALDAIQATTSERLAPFREAISAVRRVLRGLGLEDKADTPEQKRMLMVACRNSLADDLLPWLDATYVLLETDTKYPPLLGTGGNEGSGSYMSGFSQQIVSVLVERNWDHALTPALFGTAASGILTKQTPGHFSPEAAGGPNAGQGFSGSVGTNAWDYLLLLEGTLLFAAAAVKRLESRDAGALGYPFCVRPAGVGYGSASLSDEGPARAEMWLPLWSRPTTLPELRFLLSEGRATVNRRAARNGIDFARAVASVGVDRGIDEFQRYGFHQRNGLSYFAVPLGRFRVCPQPTVNVLDEIDEWLDRFRRAATSNTAPARAGRALRRLESAILELCRHSQPRFVQEILIALGEAEAVLATSARWRESAYVSPVPLLSEEWLSAASAANDGTREFRLAASLASIDHREIGPLRKHLEPVELRGRWPVWSETPDSGSLVWGAGGLVRNLIAVLKRRIIEAERQGKDSGLLFPGTGLYAAGLGDIAVFIDGTVDDERIEALLRGLILIDWKKANARERLGAGDRLPMPGAAYALLKLCHLPFELDGTSIPLAPMIANRAAAGDLRRATELAARRLQAKGFPPAVQCVPAANPESAVRTAAALIFPISVDDARRLKNSVVRFAEPDEELEPSEAVVTEDD